MNHPKLDPMKYQFGAAFVRELLDYDMGTGVFTWRKTEKRPANWNALYAGRRAGYINHWGRRVIAIQSGDKKRRYYAAILAWVWVTGDWPSDEIDHKNTIECDDRWENLRLATSSQNKFNRSLRNSTGFKGVYLDKRTGRFGASAGRRGTKRNLGKFNTAEEAHAAYGARVVELAGEFARTA